MKKRKKYRPVYRKGYKPKVSKVKKVEQSKFIKKIDATAQKYDEFLESTRSKGRYIKSEFVKAKDIIVPRAQETGEMVGGVVRPVGVFFQKAGRGIKEGISLNAPLDIQEKQYRNQSQRFQKFRRQRRLRSFKLPKLWSGS